MALSFEEFRRAWENSSEDQSELVLETAWRRYQQIQADDYETKPVEEDPSLEQLRYAFRPALNTPLLTCNHKFITLPASNLPWTPTGIYMEEDQAVSVLSTGRTWRSKLLDLYLPPKDNLWFRIGVNGSIFNSTHDTKTFMCMDGQAGQELFLANQFPGFFSDKDGGRVGADLSVYDKAEGAFQILILVWKPGLSINYDIRPAFHQLWHPEGEEQPIFDPFGLMSIGIDRLNSDYIIHKFPHGWTLLWSLGMSQIFYQEQEAPTSEDKIAKYGLEAVPEHDAIDCQTIRTDPTNTPPVIRCLPSHSAGILQKDLRSPFPLMPGTVASWFWNVIDLPSRLREDTSFSHDCLSLAFEFENGRDIAYTWSWELPVGFGYWCPLHTRSDRDYCVVLRSGTEQLGKWFQEKRNIYEDYVEYINDGDASKAVPTQIVKVWLVAGNRLQRHRGEMLVKKIELSLVDEQEPVSML